MNDGEILLAACDAALPGQVPIGILADWCEDQGWPVSAAQLRSGLGYLSSFGSGFGFGGSSSSSVVGGFGGGGSSVGGGDGDGGGSGDGGDGGGDGSGDGGNQLSRGYVMRDGLYLICTPGGYWPYVRIGWVTRQDGLISLRNCRVLRRFGAEAQLAVLALKGPQSDTQMLAASEEEFTSVALISRAIPCDSQAWRQHCPRPEEALDASGV